MRADSNLAFLVALHGINGLGPIRLKALLDNFSDPKIVWNLSEKDLKAIGIPKPTIINFLQATSTIDPHYYLNEILSRSIKVMTIYDNDYPLLLKQIYDPPIIIFYKGEFIPQDQNSIGVVGSRKMTSYGKYVTDTFCHDLASSGLTIISGLARGVDTIAHQSALKSGGRTIAVLGGGLNQIFPADNERLAKEITEGRGVIMSEFHPDSPHLPANFPSRNRIIAGLSKAILVTEATTDSGSLITAKCALDENRDCYAVPGPVTSPTSQGCNFLIKNGAKIALSTQDILADLGIDSTPKPILDPSSLTKLEHQILSQLDSGELHVDEISRSLKISSANISASLIKMEISGFIRSLGSGIFIKS